MVFCHHPGRKATPVNGGLNPRINGARQKTGTELAGAPSRFLPSFDQMPQRSGSPLSTPSAATGGGRRPAFTEGCLTATLDDRGRRLVTLGGARPAHRRSQTNFGVTQQRRRAVYARILAAANRGIVPLEPLDEAACFGGGECLI